MTKPANIDSIEKTTGLSWDQWLTYLESIHADTLSHKEIADKVREKLQPSIDNAGWWAQGITVAYEQHSGRRQPGQRNDGTYEFAVTKTFDGSKEQAMQAWQQAVEGMQEFNTVAIASLPTTSQTDRNLHWGCNLIDGTRITADAWQKSPDKAGLAITHQKLTTKQASDEWKVYWKQFLATM